jgi:hypothetical protein
MDCDPRNGGPAEREEIIQCFGNIPETAEVITGGNGRHIYFHYSGGPVPKTLAKGIDLKGDGGYVVAPPSLHISGNRYGVDGLSGARAFLNIADTPEWLQKRISARDTNSRTQTTPDSAHWAAGERNNRLTSEAGALRRRGLSQETIEAALLAINHAQCNPPLPEPEVRAIAASVARYEPEANYRVNGVPPTGEEAAGEEGHFSGAEAGKKAVSLAGTLITGRVSDIESRPIQWLWPGRIARGKITILAGNPGLGKSQVTTSIAAVLTTGGCWPVDRAQCTPGDILFLTAEDDVADTLRPRLEAAGADLQRVHFVKGVIAGITGDGTCKERMFSLVADIQALDKKLEELGGVVAALVIDPITAYLGDVDSHKNADVRAILAPLSELAARHNVAIIGISHLTKAAGSQALMRVTGSLAFVAAARAAYLVTQDQDDKARRLFLPMKNNLGPDTTGLAFRIEEVTVSSSAGPLKTTRVAWELEPVTITADEAMQTTEPLKDDSVLDQATGWLHLTLVDGPRSAAKIFVMAKAEQIAEITLRRAAKVLNVRKEKSGMTGGWAWSLPSPKVIKTPEDNHDAHPEQVDHLRGSGSSSGVPEGGFAEEDI